MIDKMRLMPFTSFGEEILGAKTRAGSRGAEVVPDVR